MRCLKGAIFDVAVDIRKGSKTFGRWISATLSAENTQQLWIPVGFAHGLCTLEPNTEVYYKVTNPYAPECDNGLAFDDPNIGIKWPVMASKAILSAKDQIQPKLNEIEAM